PLLFLPPFLFNGASKDFSGVDFVILPLLSKELIFLRPLLVGLYFTIAIFFLSFRSFPEIAYSSDI
ncbi:hypothetical protein RF400_08445, partial [Acinetobacter baumannii]|nr:hypothetical protein [Acinetobacter baumannii]